MLQYKIPQNIGIEDKIVGPFSLRQLIILAVGASISYVIFAITSKIYELNFIEYFIIALPALFALLLAMVKIHNVSFGKYLLLTLEFAIKPKKRMWDHHGIAALVEPDLTDKTPTKETKTAEEEKGRKNVNLSDLSLVLDSGGFDHVQKVQHEDIDQAEDDDLITEAYFGHKRKESQTENMYWRTKDMQKKKLDLLAKMENKKATPAPAPAAIPTAAPEAVATPAPEKKESVVENLAKVIQEAKENNQAKKETQQAKTPPTSAPTAQTATIPPTQTVPAKKKRPRKRKPKSAQPVRKDTQVNTTNKTNPKLIQKTSKEEETSLSDLKQGGEIEINLN